MIATVKELLPKVFSAQGFQSIWFSGRTSTVSSRWNLDCFTWKRRVVFLREEELIFVLFVAARRVWNVVCNFPPLDEFGKTCCFPQGKRTSICIVYRRSTSLERRGVFFREEKLVFALLSSLDEFGTSCLICRR